MFASSSYRDCKEKGKGNPEISKLFSGLGLARHTVILTGQVRPKPLETKLERAEVLYVI
jgi:hypothetical protein